MNGMLIGLGVLVCNAAAASAQETIIRFEDLPENVQASTQYQAMGVVFDPQGWLPYGVVVPAGVGASGTTVASITCSPTCSNEFPVAFTRGFIQGATRQHVKVFVGGLGDPWASPALVTLTAYDAAGQIVAQSAPATVSAGMGIHTLLQASAAGSTIASFVVAARDYYDVGKVIAIDDLTFDNAMNGGPPDFTIAASPTVVTVLQGRSTAVGINVTRLNGSTGAIGWWPVGLPVGVTAAFAQAAVDAPTVTLTLSADVAAPVNSAAQSVYAVASPDTPTAGSSVKSLELFVNVRSSFTVSPTARLPLTGITLLGCASSTLPVTVVRDFGFTGPVVLRVDNLPTGVHAALSPSTIDFHDGGAQEPVTLRLTSDPGTPAASQQVSVVGSGPNAPESGFTVRLTIGSARITAVSPMTVSTPRELNPGTEVTVLGQGFCPGAVVQFGNQYAVAPPSFVGPNGDLLKVNVPRLASDGPLSLSFQGSPLVNSPTALTVRSYRNQDGYSFHNPTSVDVEFSDVDELFGYDQTHLAIDFCWPFGCTWTTPIPSPLAAIFTGIARGALHDGQCYGMSLSSQRILHGDKALSAFPPLGAQTVFGLTGPNQAGPSPTIPTASTAGAAAAILHYAHVQHIAQLSSEFLHHYIGEAALNVSQTTGHIRSQIVDALLAGDHPYISLRHGGNGHVVVAYNIEEDGLGSGGFYVDLYDSNFEFLLTENSDADIHRFREGFTDPDTHVEYGSRLHLTSNGQWSLPHVNGDDPWTGRLDELVVTAYPVVPVRPTMPSSFDGLITLIFGDAAHTAQISDNTNHLLLDPSGQMNRDPARALPNATRFAPLVGSDDESDIYLLRGRGVFRQTIVGTRIGSYTNAAWSSTGATQVTTDASERSHDEVTRATGMAGMTFRSTATPRAYTVDVASTAPDQSQRRLVLHSVSSPEGDTVAFDQSLESVVFTHLGAATDYSFTLEWVGRTGPPSSLQSPVLHARAGDRITIAPPNWKTLGSQDTPMRILHANGQVDSSSLPATTPSREVKIVALSIVDAGHNRRRFRIQSSLTHSQERDAILVTTWNLIRNGRSIGHHVTQAAPTTLKQGTRDDDWLLPLDVRGGVRLVGSVTLIHTIPSLKSYAATATKTAVLR